MDYFENTSTTTIYQSSRLFSVERWYLHSTKNAKWVVDKSLESFQCFANTSESSIDGKQLIFLLAVGTEKKEELQRRH